MKKKTSKQDALMEVKRRRGEQDKFTPPPLTAAYVADASPRLEKEAPALSTELQKADLKASSW